MKMKMHDFFKAIFDHFNNDVSYNILCVTRKNEKRVLFYVY